MINCPFCQHKIAEDPSPEYRGQIDNLYSGTPPNDYYWYKEDDEKEEHKKRYLDKQKKNFPGNKNTYPQLETPEDQSTIASKKDNFIYTICSNCGHKIIQLGEEKTEKITNINKIPDSSFYKIDIVYIEQSPFYGGNTYQRERTGYFELDEIKNLNEKQVIDKVLNDYPVVLQPFIDEYIKKLNNNEYSDIESFFNDFNYDLESFESQETIIPEEILNTYGNGVLDNILWNKIKDKVFELDKKNIDEYIEKLYESPDYYDLDTSYYLQKDIDEVIDEIEDHPTAESFMQEGVDTIKYDYQDAKYRGNLEFPDNEFDIIGADYYENDEMKELEEYYFDKLINVMADTKGYDLGMQIIRIYYDTIIEELQNLFDEDFYMDTSKGKIAVFPNESVKKFMIDPEILEYIYDAQITVEELQKIPIYHENINEEELFRQKEKIYSPDQLSLFDIKSILESLFMKNAIQPDIRQDNAVDHENDPTDKNNPSNQDSSMGDDFNRVHSTTEVEEENNIYKKNKGKIPFRKEILQ
ncbi:MAG: hypothetical protein ACFFG0_54135 [Candidatus Thorarchaeota archaeon]